MEADDKKLSHSPFHNFRSDLPSSVVVFLVALPLCLGIALASGAPPISGVLAGIIGGIIVGAVSRSPLGVSGPAAGLAVIVLHAIGELGFELFLCAVVLGGAIQIVLGLLRAGVLAYYFPSAVIKGMLAGVGIIIVMKQVPHAFGYNAEYEGSFQFIEPSGENTFTALGAMLDYINLGSIIITAVCLGLIILWEQPIIKESKLKLVPGPLLAVGTGIGLGAIFSSTFKMGPTFFVALPDVSFSNLGALVTLPDFSGLTSPVVWKTAGVIAVVASLETLLCVEATDKLDPERRVTPTNREVFAQGTGNVISGLIGGLPITQVIVRSSANIQSGGRTKASTIIHGFLLLACLLLIPDLLRMVPLASLAAVLLVVGTKLAKPALFRQMYKGGRYQFVPFVVTIVGVVFTDLLTGVMIGMAVGIFFILYKNYRTSFHFDPDGYRPGEPVRMILSEDVSFLNKASLQRTLGALPKGARVVIDGSSVHDLDPDIDEVIRDAVVRAPHQGVQIELTGFEPESRSGPRPATDSSFFEHVEQVNGGASGRAEESKDDSNERTLHA